jgi:hypothetical protein
MAASTETLVAAARAAWERWGRSTWNLISGEKRVGKTDDNDDDAQYIIDNYCSVIDRPKPTLAEISSDVYHWSAVGLSRIFRDAGYTSEQFPFSRRHSTWITQFIRARRLGEPALYHGYRLNRPEASPAVGDIVGFVDVSTFERAQAYFDRTDRYPGHTDLVVARRPREIDVIGANVLDSVTMKTLALDENGLLADRNFKWFVVLKKMS